MLLASTFLLLAATAADPFRKVTFDEALAAAKEEKKLVLVDFESKDSEPSRQLEKRTLAESGVRSFLKTKVVAIRVDLAASAELASRFRVELAPTMLFVDAQGLEVDRYTGFLDARKFLDQARGTLAGKDGLVRARTRIERGDKDPRVRLELAQLLIDRGKNPEALQELLVCFDRGAVDDPTFAETRNKDVLVRLHRLGQVWPDALTALAERSDAAKKRVVDGSGTPADVDEAIRIDVELDRVEKLAKLYDRLKSNPEAAEARRKLAPHVLVVLLADHRYADALEAIGDPIAELEKRVASGDAVAAGVQYFEAALGAGKSETADALLERLLALEPKVGTYEKLMDHAARARDPKKAAAIGQRGLGALAAPADKARLRTALAKLPDR